MATASRPEEEGPPVLPEQGRSPAKPARSRARSRRHGAAISSARTRRPDCMTLPAGCGHVPALVATVKGMPSRRAPAVATADFLSR
jgi:hypothetical protein